MCQRSGQLESDCGEVMKKLLLLLLLLLLTFTFIPTAAFAQHPYDVLYGATFLVAPTDTPVIQFCLPQVDAVAGAIVTLDGVDQSSLSVLLLSSTPNAA